MKRVIAYATNDGKVFATEKEAVEYELNNHILQWYRVELNLSGVYSTLICAHSKEEAEENVICNFNLDDVNFGIDSVEATLTQEEGDLDDLDDQRHDYWEEY